jgi:hypothetical protein
MRHKTEGGSESYSQLEATWDCIHGSCVIKRIPRSKPKDDKVGRKSGVYSSSEQVGVYSSLEACQAACGCVVDPCKDRKTLIGWPDGIDCYQGIDAIFLLDYTGSMTGSVSVVKTGIASTVATIQGLMGATSEYRLSLVLADESNFPYGAHNELRYGNSNDYIALPANQKVNQAPIPPYIPNYSLTQHYTAVETFATNNINTFQTQINKIDTGGPPTGWPMGNGVDMPEPTDILLEMCVDSANANYPFAGQWRAGVAKYVFIYTDAPPSGVDDHFELPDLTHLNQLEATCVANGIKVFVLGDGVNSFMDVLNLRVYPWRKLAEGTGGAWDQSFSSYTLNQLIVYGCGGGGGGCDDSGGSTWNCINGSCLTPGTGVGVYSSLEACQAACGCGDGSGGGGGGGGGSSTWDCTMGSCSDPGTGTGTYASLSACQTNCVVSGGCTDPTAFNYNASATMNDGSCTYPVSGCTDPLATNYNALATVNDGSCVYYIDGCTDPTATNYNALATINNGSCTYPISGCIDPIATNYDPTATIDDGSCTYLVLGCTDPLALNYNSAATVDDGSCTYSSNPITGCTDPTATNYDATATSDDGSCIYSGCTDPTATNYNASATVDDGSCCYVAGCTDLTATNYNSSACFDDGSCTYGVPGCTDPTAFNYNASANTDDGSCIAVVNGCTDPAATNYNAAANTDDGSCIAVVNGCTDATAFNYNAAANTDDGSCIYTTYGCTDPTAFNYNAAAAVDDGSCIPYTYGCTDPTASNYNALANIDDGSCITCVYGCTNPNATNYNANATCANGSCNGCSINYSSAGDLAHIPDIHFRNLICRGCLIANGSTSSYVGGPSWNILISDWRDVNGNPDVNGEYILMSRLNPGINKLNISGNYIGGPYPNGTYTNDSGNLVSDLTGINCFTSVTQLIVTNNTSLTSIDLSLLPSLQIATINGNTALTSINTQYVTSSAFWWLTCKFNINLQHLDVSTGNQIKKLDCSNNDLYTLNVANNLNYTWHIMGNSLDARNNPNLTCINVDTNVLQYLDGSVYWFKTPYWLKDAQATWSDNC